MVAMGKRAAVLRGRWAAPAAVKGLEEHKVQLAARVAARGLEERRVPQAVPVVDAAVMDGADAVSGNDAGTLFC